MKADSEKMSDEFWQEVMRFLPAQPARPADRPFARKAGAGRKPKPPRLVFTAILFVLRTGCQWKALPFERFGSASAVHKRFLEWDRAGVFEAIWHAGLAEREEMAGIAWNWQEIRDPVTDAPSARKEGRVRPIEQGAKKRHPSSVGQRAWRPVVACRTRGKPGRWFDID